jgi:hypothetical protein
MDPKKVSGKAAGFKENQEQAAPCKNGGCPFSKVES